MKKLSITYVYKDYFDNLIIVCKHDSLQINWHHKLMKVMFGKKEKI